MVYCNYIKHDSNTVTYAYGGDVDDISGVIVFHFDIDSFEIIKHPKTEEPFTRYLHSLYYYHKKDFKNGIFGKKISYEH